MLNDIDNDLARITNLTTKEQKVLKSLQSFDSDSKGLSLSELSRKSNIPHSTLPHTLSLLKKRGFVIAQRYGARLRYFENISNALQISSPLNKNLTVQSFHGYKEIIRVFDHIASIPKKQRLAGIQPDKSIQNVFKKLPLKYLLEFNKIIKSKKLIVEGIVHEKSIATIAKHYGKHNARSVFKSFIGRLEDYVTIPDEFSDVGAEIYIFRNSANIINWETETAVVITDQNMVELLRSMFNCVKTLGRRYSQSERMRDVISSIEE